MKAFLILLLVGVAVARKGFPKPPFGPPSKTTTTTTTEATTSYCTSDESADPSQCGAAPKMANLDLKSDVLSASKTDGRTTGTCGDSARPFYQTFVEGNNRYVVISGVRAHAAECGQALVNPNERCELWQWVELPLEWTDAGQETKTMGTMGYVTSGAVVFDARSSPDGDLASCHEWASLDPSHGHSAPGGVYHYHAVSRKILHQTLQHSISKLLSDRSRQLGKMQPIPQPASSLVTC